MRLFDSHCHFLKADRAEIASVLARARAAGVEKILAVGGSVELNESARIAGELGCLVAQGYDRDQVKTVDPTNLQPSTSNLQPPTSNLQPPTFNLQPSTSNLQPSTSNLQPVLSAWGEIGLDYHYSPETRDEQVKLFGAQLELAKAADLPVVIHTREADDDTLALLREVPSRGIIHCYTGSPEFAKKLLDLGFYISISGIVTFKSAENVRAAALVVPDDRLLIETDSPFLAPVPMRGNDNEPAFVRHTCEFLAKLRGQDAEDLAELTFTNAERILS